MIIGEIFPIIWNVIIFPDHSIGPSYFISLYAAVNDNILCVCVAEVLCYGGGSGGGGGDGPPGCSGKGGRSVKEGIEEMNRAACRGAVYRSAGARSVGLLGQEKRCSVVCGAEPHSGQAGDGALPTRWR